MGSLAIIWYHPSYCSRGTLIRWLLWLGQLAMTSLAWKPCWYYSLESEIRRVDDLWPADQIELITAVVSSDRWTQQHEVSHNVVHSSTIFKAPSFRNESLFSLLFVLSGRVPAKNKQTLLAIGLTILYISHSRLYTHIPIIACMNSNTSYLLKLNLCRCSRQVYQCLGEHYEHDAFCIC